MHCLVVARLAYRLPWVAMDAAQSHLASRGRLRSSLAWSLDHGTTHRYSGGGTYFPHLGDTVDLEMGEVLIFQGQAGPYAAPHRAVPISRGARILYLAFFTLKKPKRKKRRRSQRKVVPCEVEVS